MNDSKNRSELKAIKAEFWRAHLKKLSASGKSLEDYCTDEGISHHTFRAWRTQINKLDRTSKNQVIEKRNLNREKSFTRVLVKHELPVDREKAICLPDPKWTAEFVLTLLRGGL